MTAPIPTRKRKRPHRPYVPHSKIIKPAEECEFYPDVRFKHLIGDRTGMKQGRLKFLYLVGRHYLRGNYWLCECKCGGEVITRWGAAQSCGCARTETRQKNRAAGIKAVIDADRDDNALPVESKYLRPKQFDRLTHCTRKCATYRELCPHYTECQEERVFGKKKASARYAASDGNCYVVPSDDAHLRNYHRLIAAV